MSLTDQCTGFGVIWEPPIVGYHPKIHVFLTISSTDFSCEAPVLSFFSPAAVSKHITGLLNQLLLMAEENQVP